MFLKMFCMTLAAAGLLSMTGENIAGEIHTIDPSMAKSDPNGALIWYDAKIIGVEGRGWDANECEQYYDRLPLKAKSKVTSSVWKFSKNSAGECIRFKTNSDSINARWKLNSDNINLSIMAQTGHSGVDLYVHTESGWQMIGVGKTISFPESKALLAKGLGKTEKEYLLYLPLYNGVESFEIGIAKNAYIKSCRAGDSGILCIYGSSIVQGASASRPGMTYAAVLGRRFNMTVINLGFAGSAKMEPEIAELMADVNAAVYMIDPLANMIPEEVNDRYIPFIKILRKARPETPIIMLETTNYVNSEQLPALHKRVTGVLKEFQIAHKKLVSQHTADIYKISRSDLIKAKDGTSDGTHPTDLGFSYMVDAIESVLKEAMEAKVVRQDTTVPDDVGLGKVNSATWTKAVFKIGKEEITYALAEPEKKDKSTLFLFPRFDDKEILDKGVLNDLASRLVQDGGTVVSFQSKWADLRLQSQAIKNRTDTFIETDERIRNVLDACLKSDFYSGGKIVLVGASRYGFASLYTMAKDPRVNAAVAILPVTYWPFLSEFKDMERNLIIRRHDLAGMVDKFAPRDLFIEISSQDTRVSTEMALELTGLIKHEYEIKNKSDAIKIIHSSSKGHGWRTAMNIEIIQWLKERNYISD